MDEATSALDNVTEAKVFETLESIAKTKTVLMIAHRLSTVQGCDAVHLLHEGRLDATGTYEELVEDSARFQDMAGQTDPFSSVAQSGV